MYGAYGSFPGVSVNEAKRSVASQIREGVRDLRKERRQVRWEASQDRQKAKTDYKRGNEDLSHIYGETSDYINYQQQQMDQQFAAGQDRVAASTNALLDVLNQTSTTNANAANAQMNALGIGAGGDMGEFAADATNNSAVAAQGGANAAANLGAMQTGADAIGNLVAGMNQGQYMSAQGRNLNARNDRFAEIQQGKLDNYQQVREAVGELRESRPDLVRQLLDQMQQSKWGQYMDMANLNLQRSAQRSQNRYYNSLARQSNRSGGSSFTPYGTGSSADGADSGGSDATNQALLDAILGDEGKPGSKPGGKKKPGPKPQPSGPGHGGGLYAGV
jgi:hypothetical protein